MQIRIALIASAAVLLLVQGCATSYVPVRPYAAAPSASPPGLSIGELLQMLQARRPQLDIAADLQSRGLRVAPAPADFDVLAAAGASPELLQALGATPAQAEAHIANGGVAQAEPGSGQAALGTGQPSLMAQPIPLYDVVYPWVPFGFGLGFGYYAGSARYWGYAPFWAYPPPRIGGWGYTFHPRAVHPHVFPGRGAPRGSGFRSRR